MANKQFNTEFFCNSMILNGIQIWYAVYCQYVSIHLNCFKQISTRSIILFIEGRVSGSFLIQESINS